MEKKYLALSLLPSRPNFIHTMTAEERGIMMQNVGYWQKYIDDGTMLVIGPVLDPKEAYGLGIIAVNTEGNT